MRRVPVARRDLFQDRRRTILSVTGIAAAFVLVLVLDGVFAGAMRQVTAYIRNSPADLFVAQGDVRTMHMTTSVLPADAVERARGVDGAAWADGLRYTTATIDTPADSLITYVFGYDTTSGRAGPRRLTRGRPPGHGEALVDADAADQLGVDVGDPVTILGQQFDVSGLSTDGTNIANTTAYITAEDFTALRGPQFAYVLVGATPGTPIDALRQRLGETLPGTTIMDRAEFAREEAAVVRDMAADVMLIIATIGYLIALALIAITLYNATIARQREFGVLKALGARTSRLVAVVLSQAAWTASTGTVSAVVASLVLGRIIEVVNPNVTVVIGSGAVLRTVVAAVAVAAVSAVAPLRRVARVDSATAFRRS